MRIEEIDTMAKSKYGKYIVTDLKTPDFSSEFVQEYAKFAKRILWMDNKVAEGAFQMNCSCFHFSTVTTGQYVPKKV